jgi:hypothetical protein
MLHAYLMKRGYWTTYADIQDRHFASNNLLAVIARTMQRWIDH